MASVAVTDDRSCRGHKHRVRVSDPVILEVHIILQMFWVQSGTENGSET